MKYNLYYTFGMKGGRIIMANVKTAISLDESLFCKIDQMAKELKISCSRLFAMAAEEMLHKYKNKKMLETLNEVYADGPDPEDELWIKDIKTKYRQALGAEEW